MTIASIDSNRQKWFSLTLKVNWVSLLMKRPTDRRMRHFLQSDAHFRIQSKSRFQFILKRCVCFMKKLKQNRLISDIVIFGNEGESNKNNLNRSNQMFNAFLFSPLIPVVMFTNISSKCCSLEPVNTIDLISKCVKLTRASFQSPFHFDHHVTLQKLWRTTFSFTWTNERWMRIVGNNSSETKRNEWTEWKEKKKNWALN